MLAIDTRGFLEEYLTDIDNMTDRTLKLTSPIRKAATIYLTKLAIESQQPGDIVETGLYSGGTAAAMMRALIDMDRCNRQFWGFDSFEGFPTPTIEDMEGNLRGAQVRNSMQLACMYISMCKRVYEIVD